MRVEPEKCNDDNGKRAIRPSSLCLIIVMIVCIVPHANADAQMVKEEDFFARVNAALVAGRRPPSIGRDEGAIGDGFRELALRASTNPDISLAVKLRCVADAARDAATTARTETLSPGFATPGSYSNSLVLLELAIGTMRNTPKPQLPKFLPIPPRGVAPAAIGMDPKSIRDPVLRAEYEGRIREFSRLVREHQAYKELEDGATELQRMLKQLARRVLQGETQEAKELKLLIESRDLPVSIKNDLLD